MTIDEKCRAIRNRLNRVIPETTDVDANELARLLVELTTPGVELGAAEKPVSAKTRGQEVAERFVIPEADSFIAFAGTHPSLAFAVSSRTHAETIEYRNRLLGEMRHAIARLIDAERADAVRACKAHLG